MGVCASPRGPRVRHAVMRYFSAAVESKVVDTTTLPYHDANVHILRASASHVAAEPIVELSTISWAESRGDSGPQRSH